MPSNKVVTTEYKDWVNELKKMQFQSSQIKASKMRRQCQRRQMKLMW